MYAILLVPLLFGVSWGSTGNRIRPVDRSRLFEISVIHFNDFHARFEQTGPTSGTCHEGEEKNCVGGIARLSTAVKKLMKERYSPIFLNAGDNFQGTLWYNVHRWRATAKFMNMLPHDAMTIGNHEFDNKIKGLTPFLRTVKSPVVVTNIDDSLEPRMQGLYKNSTVIIRHGIKIGIIGVILSTTNTISSTENLKFRDEVKSVNEESRRLKSQGVDIIVVLSHCGLEVDRIMAAQCPYIHIIVGGHSHTFLYTGTPPSNDIPADEYPVVVNQDFRTVLIVQAGAYTKYLGNLTVWFNHFGEIADWEGNPILLDSSIEQDPEVVEALKPWKAAVDEKAFTKVGNSKIYLDRGCRTKECNLGNLITDAMVNAYVDLAEDKTSWTYAAVSCTNTGGIRADIATTGDITYGDVMMVLPFENTLDIVELSGKCIREILEMNKILAWSGLKVTYHETNTTRTAVDVKIRCRQCEVPRFKKLKDNEWYRVVIPSFLGTAGDGYLPFKTCARNYKVGPIDSEKLLEYIGKVSPVHVGVQNRVTFI